jgi:hypothetical protein
MQVLGIVGDVGNLDVKTIIKKEYYSATFSEGSIANTQSLEYPTIYSPIKEDGMYFSTSETHVQMIGEIHYNGMVDQYGHYKLESAISSGNYPAYLQNYKGRMSTMWINIQHKDTLFVFTGTRNQSSIVDHPLYFTKVSQGFLVSDEFHTLSMYGGVMKITENKVIAFTTEGKAYVMNSLMR